MLEAIGIEPREEQVYQTLLDQPGQTVAGLARAVRLPRDAIRRAVERLTAEGLVLPSSDADPTYVVAPPDLAIGALILRRQQEIDRTRLSVPQLTERFRSSFQEASLFDLVELVVGRETSVQRFHLILETAEEEVLMLDKPPYADVVGDPIPAEIGSLSRGVRFRVLYDVSALEVPGTYDLMQRYAELGEEMRMHPDLPMKMVLVDRKFALVPFDTRGETVHGGVFLHPSPLTDALCVLFEHLWEAGSPLRLSGDPEQSDEGSPSSPLDDTDHRILTLLRAGSKDQSIADQLGLSRSTVERRVTRLSDVLGARSRFQAGYILRDRGWIE